MSQGVSLDIFTSREAFSVELNNLLKWPTEKHFHSKNISVLWCFQRALRVDEGQHSAGNHGRCADLAD